jgi:hypothetical protein
VVFSQFILLLRLSQRAPRLYRIRNHTGECVWIYFGWRPHFGGASLWCACVHLLLFLPHFFDLTKSSQLEKIFKLTTKNSTCGTQSTFAAVLANQAPHSPAFVGRFRIGARNKRASENWSAHSLLISFDQRRLSRINFGICCIRVANLQASFVFDLFFCYWLMWNWVRFLGF